MKALVNCLVNSEPLKMGDCVYKQAFLTKDDAFNLVFANMCMVS